MQSYEEDTIMTLGLLIKMTTPITHDRIQEVLQGYRQMIVERCMLAVSARSFGHAVEDAIREDFRELMK